MDDELTELTTECLQSLGSDRETSTDSNSSDSSGEKPPRKKMKTKLALLSPQSSGVPLPIKNPYNQDWHFHRGHTVPHFHTFVHGHNNGYRMQHQGGCSTASAQPRFANRLIQQEQHDIFAHQGFYPLTFGHPTRTQPPAHIPNPSLEQFPQGAASSVQTTTHHHQTFPSTERQQTVADPIIFQEGPASAENLTVYDSNKDVGSPHLTSMPTPTDHGSHCDSPIFPRDINNHDYEEANFPQDKDSSSSTTKNETEVLKIFVMLHVK